MTEAVLAPDALFAPAAEPPAPAPAAAPRAAVRGSDTVAGWKSQVSWFAAAMTVLVVLVSTASGLAMRHVLAEVAQGERHWDERSAAAMAARITVVEVDRSLAQTVAEEDPAKLRAAAVQSISTAARLEDAVNTLRQVLPANADVLSMVRLVEAVKAPRVNVIVLARKGERAAALQALDGIAEPLRRIDGLSSAILQEQRVQREQAAREREALFDRLLAGLAGAGAASVLLAILFYRRLMRRFARADQVEQLLAQVAESAGSLDQGGRELDGVNHEVRRTNENLGTLLGRVESTAQAITQEAETCLRDLDELGRTCERSAALSNDHAGEAEAVAERIHAASVQMSILTQSTQGLRQSCAAISGCADDIAAISATTRLLSLNAAVEAARAGAAGRGFGVIASSVRQLSEDTHAAVAQIRQASASIATQLTATLQAVHDTGALMQDCASRITVLDTSAQSNRELVHGMSGGVQGFRGSFQRQVDRIGAMEGESQALVAALRDGQRHAELLDAASSSMADTSARLLRRLSSLQA